MILGPDLTAVNQLPIYLIYTIKNFENIIIQKYPIAFEEIL